MSDGGAVVLLVEDDENGRSAIAGTCGRAATTSTRRATCARR